MAALDDFQIEGDTLKFNILHEDWADGDLPTFYKHVTAQIGWNEMRCSTAADHMPPRPLPSGALPGFSLTGPIPIEGDGPATCGPNGRRRTRRSPASREGFDSASRYVRWKRHFVPLLKGKREANSKMLFEKLYKSIRSKSGASNTRSPGNDRFPLH